MKNIVQWRDQRHEVDDATWRELHRRGFLSFVYQSAELRTGAINVPDYIRPDRGYCNQWKESVRATTLD